MSKRSKNSRWPLLVLALALVAVWGIWTYFSKGNSPLLVLKPVPAATAVTPHLSPTPIETSTPTATATFVPLYITSQPGASFRWKALVPPYKGYYTQACHSMAVFKDRLWMTGGMSEFSGISMTVKKNGAVSLGGWVHDTRPGSNDVWVTDNGVYWDRAVEHADFEPRVSPGLVAFHDRLWLIGGGRSDGTYGKVKEQDLCADIWATEDGLHWKQVTASAPFKGRLGPACYVYHDKLWVLGGRTSEGDQADIWSSSDGEHWTQETAKAEFPARSSAGIAEFNGKLWLMGGGDFFSGIGDIWSSEDGKNWHLETDDPPFGKLVGPHCFVLQGKLWVLNEPDEQYGSMDLWCTADGKNWEQPDLDRQFSSRWKCACAVFKDRVWLTGGRWYGTYFGETLSSANGTEWSKPEAVSLPAHDPQMSFYGGARAVAYKDKLWVLCQVQHHYHLYSSTDGVNWPTNQWMEPGDFDGYSFFVFQDKLWLIDQELAAIYTSEDGNKWTLVKPQAEFGRRFGAAVALAPDGLWLAGGQVGGLRGPNDNGRPQDSWKYSNDVWHSTDGIQWTKVNDAAPFLPRINATLYSWQGKLWLTGGRPNRWMNDPHTDLWSSKDGKNWDRVMEKSPFSWDWECHVLSYDGQLWMVQGQHEHEPNKGPYMPFLWRSKDGSHWTLDDELLEMGAKWDFNFLVFQDHLWFINEGYGDQTWADVWRAEK